jgi:hypothetical protein
LQERRLDLLFKEMFYWRIYLTLLSSTNNGPAEMCLWHVSNPK